MIGRIIYLKGKTSEHEELVQTVQKIGYQIVFAGSFDEAVEQARKHKIFRVLIDASAGMQEVSQRVVELSGSRDFVNSCIVFFGKDVTKRERVLSHLYPKLLLLDIPFETSEVISVVCACLEATGANEAVEEEEFHETDWEKQRTILPANHLGLDHSPGKRSFDGKSLRRLNQLSDFNDDLLLPAGLENAKVRAGLAEISKKSSWLGVHSRRTALVATSIISKLYPKEKEDWTLRTAALLLNWSIVDNEQWLKHDLLGEGRPEYLQVFGNSFRESGAVIERKVGDNRAAMMINVLADVLSGRESGADEDLRKKAEVVLVSELVDRSCASLGFWMGAVVPRVLRLLRESVLFKNRDVVEEIAKILGEAVQPNFSGDETQGSAMVFPRAKFRAKQRLIKNDSSYPQGGREIRLFQLKPGLILAAPLYSNDGRLVLDSETVIDSDLLIRLIEMSVTRGMPPHVVVKK